MHQTSGTSGKPLKILDTSESWDWWLRCWSFVYRGAGVGTADRIYMAFSFGPFIGFWSAYEAAEKIGVLAIPGGGLQTKARIHAIIDNEATVLVCTPTYALRLAEVAAEQNIDIVDSSIKRVICAGEPGANIPATKKRIENSWGAKCFDHTGMTEVGAIGFECESQPGGIHLIESEFMVEVIDPVTGKPLSAGNKGELVITNLGRNSMPVFRYRTGDLVKLNYTSCDCGRTFVRADGGILGRADDMFVVRGINIFPSAIENVIRECNEVEEFRIEIYKEREMNEINIKLELNPSIQSPDTVTSIAQSIVDELQTKLLLTAKTTIVPCGSLPRFDMKAKRCVICD
jgi:phenylacetate-CoA ligase